MKRYGLAALLIVGLLAGGLKARDYYLDVTMGYPFALVWNQPRAEFWEPAIAEYEKADRANPPAPGQILFVGSSSIDYWQTLEADMAPLAVLERGFGGANLSHVTHYAGRIVIPYRPRAIVLFAGGNDFRGFFPKSPDEIAGDFRDLDSLLREALPQVRLHYISIKPTFTDWDKWPEIDRLNATIRAYTESDARLNFIDISAVMLGDDGQPRRELFRPDGIHLSAAGYAQWTAVIRPVLMREYGRGS